MQFTHSGQKLTTTNNNWYSLVSCVRSPVALPPVLEPVANLGRREAGGLGELLLLGRVRIGVLQVGLAQEVSGALLVG